MNEHLDMPKWWNQPEVEELRNKNNLLTGLCWILSLLSAMLLTAVLFLGNK